MLLKMISFLKESVDEGGGGGDPSGNLELEGDASGSLELEGDASGNLELEGT